jgi:hypothetical protein
MRVLKVNKENTKNIFSFLLPHHVYGTVSHQNRRFCLDGTLIKSPKVLISRLSGLS